MKFVCYSDWKQLPESADHLFEQVQQDNLFFTREWFENVSMTLEQGQVLMLACVVAENEVLAILPLAKSDAQTWYSLTHRYTTHFSLLILKPQQQAALDCLVQGLTELPCKGFILEPVADDDQNINALQASLENAGYVCERRFRFYNWIHRVAGQTFSEYLTQRPGSLRNTIVRKSRKLEREHGYDIRLYIGNDVPQAMPDYHAVYRASWKANEQYVRFVDNIVADFSSAGWSRLAVLYVKGRPVAAQLWFVVQHKASIFRLSYDETWKAYSPGSILTQYLMKYVIDTDKVNEIDFLTGNEAYKQDWMSERQQQFALSCVKNDLPKKWYDRLLAALRRVI